MMGVDVAVEVESVEASLGASNASTASAPRIVLEQMCKKVVEIQLRKGFVEPDHLHSAGIIITGYDSAWRKRDLHHRTEATLADVKYRLQQANIILTTFRWVHEELLPASCFVAPSSHVHTGGLKLKLRQPLLTELQVNLFWSVSERGVGGGSILAHCRFRDCLKCLLNGMNVKKINFILKINFNY